MPEHIPADTATTVNSVCPKCGSIPKSGKRSCCGRGGSWFRNCGGAGNSKFDHTWYDGIQACKRWAQSKRVSGQQSNAAQQLNCFNCSKMAAKSKSPIAPATTNITTVTPEHDTETANSQAITSTSPALNTTASDHTSIANTLSGMLTTAPAHTNTLSTTTAIIATSITDTATTTTRTSAVVISHSVTETTISTDWILNVRFYDRRVSESVLLYTSQLHTLFFIYIILFE